MLFGLKYIHSDESKQNANYLTINYILTTKKLLEGIMLYFFSMLIYKDGKVVL